MIVPPEVLEGEVLFEFFKQQFNLPSVLVNGHNRGCFQLQVVGQKYEEFVVFLIPVGNPSELNWMFLVVHGVLNNDSFVFEDFLV